MAETATLLPRAQNFRAIAPLPAGEGRRLRAGTLYRSGDMTELSEDCVDRLRLLGIRSVVDLRSAQERERRPYLWLNAIDVEFWGDANLTSSASIGALVKRSEVSVADVTAAMAGLYTRILVSHAGSIGEIVRRIIARRAPIVFGCAAGKDRTGVAAALLLWQVGVPREHIMADYLASNAAQDGLLALVELAFRWNVQAPHVRAALSADPVFLEAAFAEVERRWGGIDAYFEAMLGVDGTGREALRAALTEADQ